MPAVLCRFPPQDRESATGKSLLHQSPLQGTNRVRQCASEVIKGLILPKLQKADVAFLHLAASSQADHVWFYVSGYYIFLSSIRFGPIRTHEQ